MTAAESNCEEMLSQYRAAVDAWVAAIRREEALAAATQSVADLDLWEEAGAAEDEARNQVKAAKRSYEDALRQKFFNF